MRWLKQGGNHIGCTVRVDFATLLASRGKFAHICVEVDLDKPLMAGYTMRGDYYRLQYEGLIELCFGCGRYGHRYPICPEKTNGGEKSNGKDDKDLNTNGDPNEAMAGGGVRGNQG